MTDSNVAEQAGGTEPRDSDRSTVIERAAAERADPVSLSTDVTVIEGVALVTCRVRNRTPVERGVRLRDRLDGPTLPPRSEGAPAVGWENSTYETVVSAGETVAVGYACPLGEDADVERPVELDAVGPSSLVECSEDDTETLVARARRLGDSRPPQDAVPITVSDSDHTATTDSDHAVTADHDHAATTNHDQTATASPPLADGICPGPVETYFERATERIRRAEGTTDGSVESVATAFRRSHHTPVTLEQAVARDEAALRAISERAEELADRAAETDVPVDTLRRLV